MKILITGAAGFVGSHLVKRLGQKAEYEVVGIDNFDSYYAVELKVRRKEILVAPNRFYEIDINSDKLKELFSREKFSAVIHLAAQPGVRLGIESADRYIDNNVSGFISLAKLIREFEIPYFLYASSSSVYGDKAISPFVETETSVEPKSLYGITKLMDEHLARALMARTVARSRGLRFFTVYGPWGRPDMAYFRAIASVTNGFEFPKFGDGEVRRDFTYIDDITESIELLLLELQTRKEGFCDVVNIGGGKPITLNDLLISIQRYGRFPITIRQMERNPEDVKMTFASFKYLNELTGKSVFTDLAHGLESTVNWMKELDPSVVKNWVESVP
jgi:UDP-glucuronate 4-epimerase